MRDMVLLTNGNAQDIAQSIFGRVWKLEIQSPNLFRLLDHDAERLFEPWQFTSNVANCVWACGNLGIQIPQPFQTARSWSKFVCLTDGNAHTIASCVWACGKLKLQSPNLFTLLDREAEHLFDYGTSQAIANCIWACGKLGIKSPNLFRLLDREAEDFFIHGNERGIATSIWACGKLGLQSPNLFRLLDRGSRTFVYQWQYTRILELHLGLWDAWNSVPQSLQTARS